MKKIKSLALISFFVFSISAYSFFVTTAASTGAATSAITGSSTPRTLHTAASSQANPEVRATINVSGTIETVDIGTRTITAHINGVYGAVSGTARLGFTLAPATVLSLSIPQGIPLTRLGIPIALVALKPGDTFTARAIIDRDTQIGIIQTMHVNSPETPLPIIIGAISDITSNTITVKTSSTTEQQFAVTPQTKIFTNAKAGAVGDLTTGRNVAISFTLNGNAMKAIIIETSSSALTPNRAAALFSIHTLIARGQRAVHILDAFLYRLNSIILKQENLAANFKQNGKDTTHLDILISLSKTDLTSAQSSLSNTSKTFNALLRSLDPKKDAITARDQLVTAVTAGRNIFTDITQTETQLHTLSK